MKKMLLLLVMTCFCFSCLDYDNQKSENKEWVYLEIETKMKKDTTNSFVYGKIKKSVLDKIQKNEKAKGIFFIEEVRFINDNDRLQVYEDKNDRGILGYRIEHIQTIEFYKKDPILIFEKERLDKSALKVLKSYAQK